MVPKPFQNRSWRGSGSHLGATLETRCFQDLIFDDFGSILGPPLGPVWFGVILDIIFLMFFWSGFLMALASIWAPKTPPKWDPKGGQIPNLKIIFLFLFSTLWPHSGVLKINFFYVFLKCLFDGLGLHLGSQTPPKWDLKGGQNQKLKFIDFVSIYYTLATFRGAENHHFVVFFWNSVLGWLLEPILVILAHFWGPFWRPFWSLFGYHFCIDF